MFIGMYSVLYTKRKMSEGWNISVETKTVCIFLIENREQMKKEIIDVGNTHR